MITSHPLWPFYWRFTLLILGALLLLSWLNLNPAWRWLYPQVGLVALLVWARLLPSRGLLSVAALMGLVFDMVQFMPLGCHMLLFALPVWCLLRWPRYFSQLNRFYEVLAIWLLSLLSNAAVSAMLYMTHANLAWGRYWVASLLNAGCVMLVMMWLASYAVTTKRSVTISRP